MSGCFWVFLQNTRFRYSNSLFNIASCLIDMLSSMESRTELLLLLQTCSMCNCLHLSLSQFHSSNHSGPKSVSYCGYSLLCHILLKCASTLKILSESDQFLSHPYFSIYNIDLNLLPSVLPFLPFSFHSSSLLGLLLKCSFCGSTVPTTFLGHSSSHLVSVWSLVFGCPPEGHFFTHTFS